jgi:hypothetical protein
MTPGRAPTTRRAVQSYGCRYLQQERFLEVLDVSARLSLASGAGNDLNHVAAIVQA